MGELLTKKSLKEVHWEPDKGETQYNIQTVNYLPDGCFIQLRECLGCAEQLSIMDPIKQCPQFLQTQTSSMPPWVASLWCNA